MLNFENKKSQVPMLGAHKNKKSLPKLTVTASLIVILIRFMALKHPSK
jgi:hypothetical protein